MFCTPSASVTWITILIWVFTDEELEDWCEKSVFRKQKKPVNRTGRAVSTSKFSGALKELEKLEKASQTVGIGG